MYTPKRLMAFADGVIAIAITLLVLGLQIPSVDKVPEGQLTRYLLHDLHPLLGYVSSFLLVGTYWVQHYVIFHYVTRVDRIFLGLNGLFLLTVSFVPFPTGLQATYRHDEMAMVLYAATQAACGLSLLAIWNYATKNHQLVAPNVPPEVVLSMRRRIVVTPLVSLAAMAVSFLAIDVSRIMFLVIPAAQFSHRAVDERLP